MEFLTCSPGSAGSKSIECLVASVLPQFPRGKLGQLRSRDVKEKQIVWCEDMLPLNPQLQGFIAMCCLDPYRCLRSPEPAAPSAVLISVSTRFGFLLLKNKLWLGFFWCKTPGFCAALAHALASVSYILHQLFSLCLAGELHHVDKPVCVGAAPVIFAPVPRCSPQPSLSARISSCLEESCA